MLTLDKLKKGQSAVVLEVNASQELKKRLLAFGVSKGAYLEVKAFSPIRDSMTVVVNKTTMALRLDEASQIEVVLETD